MIAQRSAAIVAQISGIAEKLFAALHWILFFIKEGSKGGRGGGGLERLLGRWWLPHVLIYSFVLSFIHAESETKSRGGLRLISLSIQMGC